jgi:NAD(P)H-hydrate epimerase
MKVLTAAQMREADRQSIAAGIPGLVLMENAAYAVLRELESVFPRLHAERIAIFCGKGNNGGDGLALARLLRRLHRPAALDVILAYPPEQLSDDAAAQLRMLRLSGVSVLSEEPRHLGATTLAIDAMLGTGSAGEPKEPLAKWIRVFNDLPVARRWAVDWPSGLGSALCVRVETTVTFAAPKLELVYGWTAEQVGRLVVADIGIPQQFLQASLHLTDREDLAPVLHSRQRDTHKGSFGHVAVLGGAHGKHGALQLAGQAALRIGAGLVTLYSPDVTFLPRWPDLMLGEWPTTKIEESKTVIAVGPGLGLDAAQTSCLSAWVAEESRPMVLDADALNQLAPWSVEIAPGRLRVLTPHPKEMSRLLGRPLGDRLADARAFAQQWNVALVLKGQRSLIAWPDGQVWINPTGAPSLAKGGTGDVLTGMIAGMLAQFPGEARAALLAAVYLHGRCGELVAQERTLLASEMNQKFGEALLELA